MIKALYSVKYSSNAYKASILIAIPCKQGNLLDEYLHSEIGICCQTLYAQWGYALTPNLWIVTDFNLNPDEFIDYRVKVEDLGSFDSANLAIAIAESTIEYYRNLLTLISEHYRQASKQNRIVTLG